MLLINTGIFFLLMKILKKNLIKNRSLRIEEIKFTPNNRRQPHFEKQSLKIMKTTINQIEQSLQ